jgi:hypothetical protein
VVTELSRVDQIISDDGAEIRLPVQAVESVLAGAHNIVNNSLYLQIVIAASLLSLRTTLK